MLIMIILSVLSASAFYSKAKKAGVPPVKWALIGILTAVAPLVLIPNIIVLTTGRPDLDGLAIMLAVVIAMWLSAIMIKRMQSQKT